MNVGFSKGHALVIGIADYDHFTPLPDAVLNDASDFAALLKDADFCGYPADQVDLILNKEATRNSIIAGLRSLAQRTGPGDTAVVFFSGHGVLADAGAKADSFLVPVNGEQEHLHKSAIHSEEFTSLLSDVRAQRLTVFLDACHAAGAGNISKGPTGRHVKSGLDADTYDRLSAGAGRVLIASSGVDEVSWVRQGMRNSVFTHFLLSALKGGSHVRSDGLIGVLDVFTYLAENVPTMEPRQNPLLKVHARNNFPLALYRGGGSDTVAGLARTDISGAGTPETWITLEQLATRLYPRGPTDNEIWSRSGGDLSRLALGATGVAAWHDAIAKLREGGGGKRISADSLLAAMKSDFPNNQDIVRLTSAEPPRSPKRAEVRRHPLIVSAPHGGHKLRFTKLIAGEAVAPGERQSFAISDMPLTYRDLRALGWQQFPSGERAVALLDREAAEQALQEFSRLLDARVRLPNYVEWRLAMAATNSAPQTPQQSIPAKVDPALDHWVRNEWDIGRPPASLPEWIGGAERALEISSAPAARIKVNGGHVTFASALRPVEHRLPMRLVLESGDADQ